jgi:hypothetical protein
VKLEQLFIVPAHGRGESRGDDGALEVLARVNGFCPTAHEELVIDVRRREGMEGEARVPTKVGALWRLAQDEGPQATIRYNGTERVDSRPTIRPHCGQEAQRRSVLVQELSPGPG